MRYAVPLLLAMLFLAGCGKEDEMNTVPEMFEAELRKREVQFTGPDDEGLYKLALNTGEVTVNLENITRNFERDGDAEAIVRFVDQVLSGPALPGWEQAKSLLFYSAEPADHDFGDTIKWPVSKEVCKVLVVTDSEEGKITWVTPATLKKWGVSIADAAAAADANMDGLLKDKEPELAGEIDGMSLGMVPVSSVFKASVIFSPNFKEFATKKLEWPVLAVIPCRDFIYILAEKDKALLNRMGKVVKDEYGKSGYPITTEVFKISDDGIEAVGAFPK